MDNKRIPGWRQCASCLYRFFFLQNERIVYIVCCIPYAHFTYSTNIIFYNSKTYLMSLLQQQQQQNSKEIKLTVTAWRLLNIKSEKWLQMILYVTWTNKWLQFYKYQAKCLGKDAQSEKKNQKRKRKRIQVER